MRISKTEFISCPSCGRTLFDLPGAQPVLSPAACANGICAPCARQETTAKIQARTGHLPGWNAWGTSWARVISLLLPGVRIAVMGCIVNGPAPWTPAPLITSFSVTQGLGSGICLACTDGNGWQLLRTECNMCWRHREQAFIRPACDQ